MFRWIQWLQVRLAASRMGLRDKGLVEIFYKNGGWWFLTCCRCNARLRIGINSNKLPVTYCWKCENIKYEKSDDGGNDNFDPSLYPKILDRCRN